MVLTESAIFLAAAAVAVPLFKRLGLGTLGTGDEEASRAVGRFVAYDEAAIVEQFTHRNDEQALIANSKQVAADLEKIFEEDAKSDGV